ncbi:MAG TPA: FecR family protein [Steroidobacteraceae bacterium]|nr:FecR family protein [Steroidobacteraceae bacterium]
MKPDTDIVEMLIRSAGRRAEPPADAHGQVFAAAHASFRAKIQGRRRAWILRASAAAALVVAVALVVRWAPPGVPQGKIAQVSRIVGEVELATADGWQPLTEPRSRLAAGSRVRTQAAGRVALTLGGGESLRLAARTEVMLDAPGRLYVQAGTIYVDSGERPSAARIEVVTPAGTARDVGTQFELHVEGAALRLRVREGLVMLDRGGRSLAGRAGEQLTVDGLGSVTRASISPTDPAWHWAEAVASMPDMDGKPASALIAWVARETGRRLQYESPIVEQRAAAVILHGDIRHLAPLEALEAMLATTDLRVELDGDTMEIRSRTVETR